VDETQELKLLTGQHLVFPGRLTRQSHCRAGAGQKQIMNEHYLFDMCSATT
jgi:hypothetical protein